MKYTVYLLFKEVIEENAILVHTKYCIVFELFELFPILLIKIDEKHKYSMCTDLFVNVEKFVEHL